MMILTLPAKLGPLTICSYLEAPITPALVLYSSGSSNYLPEDCYLTVE